MKPDLPLSQLIDGCRDKAEIPQFIPHRVDYDKSGWLSGRDSIPRAAAELQAQQFGADRA
jgi:hypothetical protein